MKKRFKTLLVASSFVLSSCANPFDAIDGFFGQFMPIESFKIGAPTIIASGGTISFTAMKNVDYYLVYEGEKELAKIDATDESNWTYDSAIIEATGKIKPNAPSSPSTSSSSKSTSTSGSAEPQIVEFRPEPALIETVDHYTDHAISYTPYFEDMETHSVHVVAHAYSPRYRSSPESIDVQVTMQKLDVPSPYLIGDSIAWAPVKGATKYGIYVYESNEAIATTESNVFNRKTLKPQYQAEALRVRSFYGPAALNELSSGYSSFATATLPSGEIFVPEEVEEFNVPLYSHEDVAKRYFTLLPRTRDIAFNVDGDFTASIESPYFVGWEDPKEESAKITININGSSEFYLSAPKSEPCSFVNAKDFTLNITESCKLTGIVNDPKQENIFKMSNATINSHGNFGVYGQCTSNSNKIALNTLSIDSLAYHGSNANASMRVTGAIGFNNGSPGGSAIRVNEKMTITAGFFAFSGAKGGAGKPGATGESGTSDGKEGGRGGNGEQGGRGGDAAFIKSLEVSPSSYDAISSFILAGGDGGMGGMGGNGGTGGYKKRGGRGGDGGTPGNGGHALFGGLTEQELKDIFAKAITYPNGVLSLSNGVSGLYGVGGCGGTGGSGAKGGDGGNSGSNQGSKATSQSGGAGALPIIDIYG